MLREVCVWVSTCVCVRAQAEQAQAIQAQTVQAQAMQAQTVQANRASAGHASASRANAGHASRLLARWHFSAGNALPLRMQAATVAMQLPCRAAKLARAGSSRGAQGMEREGMGRQVGGRGQAAGSARGEWGWRILKKVMHLSEEAIGHKGVGGTAPGLLKYVPNITGGLFYPNGVGTHLGLHPGIRSSFLGQEQQNFACN